MTAPSPTREGTRERILAAAVDLFAEHGFEATSLQQIADVLPVTKAAVYYHFRSKDDLLATLVEPVFADLEARLQAAQIGKPSPAARRAALTGFLDGLIAHHQMIGFITRDPAVRANPVVLARAERIQDRIDTVLLGADMDEPCRIVASMVLGSMYSAVVEHGDADPALLRPIVVESVEAMLRTVRRRPKVAH
ncbi:TetR/AcrR family transcriptional regulator [Aldersonia sp. NBC_00410]|uniref:TetR/AcrR family transcriptional regulator n=1 Tax=Aldersonia sp. NBC_00410 TaxID=2975954 RepID=UPI00224CA0CB|nr:TetR/AcrR family transcriptional regulator [Aldersonia sp. NBC_00410]MCX5041757.1 TetR/AcrR family transcriptional regulator [Aldersonia sp. NBC_00410]